MVVLATRDLERELLESYRFVVGMDEVGRGALAGPVTVGVAIVDSSVGEAPEGLGDSKLLSARRRRSLVEPIHQWAQAAAIGWASPMEIDRWGIVGALRVAGQRALLAAWPSSLEELASSIIVLDGSHDWFTEPVPDLMSLMEGSDVAVDEQWADRGVRAPRVQTRVKADVDCAVVAAASNIAKVQRDDLMAGYDDPGYGWSSNKGYASAAHIEGLRRLGPSALHRRSWNLPGLDGSQEGIGR